MTDLEKDLGRLQREIDQARTNAAKARKGHSTEVISQRKISKRVFALVLPIVLIGIAWVIEIVDQTFFAGSLNFPVSPGGPLWGIITINSNRYRAEDIEACLPPVPPPPKPRLPYRPRGRKQLQLDRVLDALSHIPRRVKGGGTYGEMRNVAWALRACLEECGQPDPEAAAIQLLEAHSPSRECGWDVAQVVRSGGQQIGPGTLFHHAKQHGYKPKRHG